jgi:aspartyl-tRNA(Asn)/glutamyl-tRNA(Gln) amidotransferase subunit B
MTSQFQKDRNDEYKVLIGLETHIQVATKTKLFCSCKNTFGAPPNSVVCEICLGLPGVLPQLNQEAVKKAIKAALVLNCTINKTSYFDRKNYFYPDIPKSYQITQYFTPIACNGFIELHNGKKIRIKRLHIEEDVGKLLHPELGKVKDDSYQLGVIRADYSYIDMNRSGVPLFEIVTEPDINSADEAYEYLLTLKRKLQFHNISNCDMEKGQLRCDVNISVGKTMDKESTNRVEIKNLNSFKFIKEAINYEITRQINLIKSGAKVIQETRLYDPYKKITYPLRSKEEAQDYRYFPEPDLPPLLIQEEFIEEIKKTIELTPLELVDKYITEGQISLKEKEILLSNEEMCLFFLEVAKRTDNPKASFNWVANELQGIANELKTTVWDLGISIFDIVEFIKMVTGGKLDKSYAKELLRISIKEKKALKKID